MESVYRQSGYKVKPEQLANEVLMPEWADLLWGIFSNLTRQWVEGRPKSVSSLEIEAYCRLSNIELDTIEFLLIKDLDEEFVKSYA